MIISKEQVQKLEKVVSTIYSIAESLELVYPNSETEVKMLSNAGNILDEITWDVSHPKLEVQNSINKGGVNV